MALLPSAAQFENLKIISTSPIFMSVSHSMKRQVRSRGNVQRWAFKGSLVVMTRSEAAELFAFINALSGRLTTFEFSPPEYSNTLGTATGTAAVNNVGGYAAGATSVAFDGLTGDLKAGDFVTFAGHTKVYQLTADSTTTIEIYPALMAPVADDEVITYNGVQFTVALTRDKQEFSAELHFLNHKMEMVEVY